MGKERADLGFSDALDDFNPADWPGKPPRGLKRPLETETAKAAAAAGFRSREPLAAPERAGEGSPARRRRTGRNAQFNIKATPETIAAFYAIADRHGWGLGETLEHAVAALEERQGTRSEQM